MVVPFWPWHHRDHSEFVTWDDDIPNMNGKIKAMFQTTNQICIIMCIFLRTVLISAKRQHTIPQQKTQFQSEAKYTFHHFIIRTSNPPILFPSQKKNRGKLWQTGPEDKDCQREPQKASSQETAVP